MFAEEQAIDLGQGDPLEFNGARREFWGGTLHRRIAGDAPTLGEEFRELGRLSAAFLALELGARPLEELIRQAGAQRLANLTRVEALVQILLVELQAAVQFVEGFTTDGQAEGFEPALAGALNSRGRVPREETNGRRFQIPFADPGFLWLDAAGHLEDQDLSSGAEGLQAGFLQILVPRLLACRLPPAFDKRAVEFMGLAANDVADRVFAHKMGHGEQGRRNTQRISHSLGALRG